MLAHPTLASPKDTLTRFMAAGVVTGVVLATFPSLMTCGPSTLLDVAATARQSHGIHLALLGTGTAIALGVCGTLLYSIGTFRATGEAASAGVRRAIREIVWAFVPIAILVGAATPAVHAFIVTDTAATEQHAPIESHRCEIGQGSQR